MNEWELLEVAEDIEQGDTLSVDSDDGAERVIFRKYDKGIVWTKDQLSGNTRKFRGSSLEEISGTGYITGKSEATEEE